MLSIILIDTNDGSGKNFMKTKLHEDKFAPRVKFAWKVIFTRKKKYYKKQKK